MIKRMKLSLLPKLVIGTFIIITVLFAMTGIKRIYYERIRSIESGVANINEFDFTEHWNRVADALQWTEEAMQRAKIEDLRIVYEKTNEIETFNYAVVWEEAQGKRHESVHFNRESGKFEIQARKIGEWPQYDRLISGERAFDLLAETKISDLYIDNKKSDSPARNIEFYGLAFGERDSLSFTDGDIFVLEGSKIVPFTGKLPVEASWLRTYNLAQASETTNEPVQGNYFLFDVKQN